MRVRCVAERCGAVWCGGAVRCVAVPRVCEAAHVVRVAACAGELGIEVRVDEMALDFRVGRTAGLLREEVEVEVDDLRQHSLQPCGDDGSLQGPTADC